MIGLDSGCLHERHRRIPPDVPPPRPPLPYGIEHTGAEASRPCLADLLPMSARLCGLSHTGQGQLITTSHSELAVGRSFHSTQKIVFCLHINLVLWLSGSSSGLPNICSSCNRSGKERVKTKPHGRSRWPGLTLARTFPARSQEYSGC